MSEDNRYIKVSVDSFNQMIKLDDEKQKVFEELYRAGEAAINTIAMFQNYCHSNNIHLPEWLEKYGTNSFNQLSEAVYRVKEVKLINSL